VNKKSEHQFSSYAIPLCWDQIHVEQNPVLFELVQVDVPVHLVDAVAFCFPPKLEGHTQQPRKYKTVTFTKTNQLTNLLCELVLYKKSRQTKVLA